MSAARDADVAVIGAGPYGLAVAAHLRSRGIGVHVLGREMEFWARQMPAGMFLRSSWEASSIADPHGALTLDAYEAAHGTRLSRPVPLDDFVAYGRWFRRHAVPDLDHRHAVSVARENGGFRVQLEGGEALHAPRVVMATGLAAFENRPPELASLGRPLVQHSSDLSDLSDFRGRRTAVVGAGQSAVELAALLGEAGAQVEVIARAPAIRWLRRSGWLHEHSGPVRRLLYPPTDVGPLGLSWLVAAPDVFRRVPSRWGDRMSYRCIRPAATSWLLPRTTAVTLSLGRRIVEAWPVDGALTLQLDDGTARTVDRLVLATGYRVHLDRHPLLDRRLLDRIRARDGAPQLGPGLESSVPGLHLVGALAAPTFGPILRFVSGTPFAARALAAHVAARARPARSRVAVDAVTAPG